jgi:UDP-N-acetylmuramoyl-L-alanyl-D-glutamate--2,6-diaminopimelate ligase
MPNFSCQFDELLRGIDVVARSGGNPFICDVVYDSRQVKPGAVFIAMQGGTTDGNRFIAKALEQGAAAVLTDSEAMWKQLRESQPALALANVRHGRLALAQVSANFFCHPERKLQLCGVTGTNGKTTTTYLIESMLRSAGRETVLLGTIEYHVVDSVLPSPHTTPESRDIFKYLAKGVESGATEAVMEVSSHALDQGRVWGLHWDTAVFTNLTQDHLDYHGDMESYFSAKAKMFQGHGAAPPRVAVIHAADEYAPRFLAVARDAACGIVTYGMEAGDFHAENIELTAHGSRFQMTSPQGAIEISTSLAGPVNVLNLLAASAAAMARGLTLDEIARGAASIPYVPGRFQNVNCGQPFTVAVDYAHTDDALRNVTRLARMLASPRNGRVITVFGCGGDRDRTKRPRMGRAAGEGSDLVIATSDNPRSEEPEAILREILPGLESTGVAFQVEPDRAQAIVLAIQAARENDVVVIAGKGHEKVQIFRDHTVPFDDADVARQALEAMGWKGTETRK